MPEMAEVSFVHLLSRKFSCNSKWDKTQGEKDEDIKVFSNSSDIFVGYCFCDFYSIIRDRIFIHGFYWYPLICRRADRNLAYGSANICFLFGIGVCLLWIFLFFPLVAETLVSGEQRGEIWGQDIWGQVLKLDLFFYF